MVVTGASAGIGRQTVTQLRARGARVIGVARRADELQILVAETGCEWRLVQDLADEQVDVLVNNAGHSIRRRIVDASDRLHDYQRTMALNYVAPVQLTLGLMPGMIQRGRGQSVNFCTWALHAKTSALLRIRGLEERAGDLRT